MSDENKHNLEQELKAMQDYITRFVEDYRRENRIKPTPGFKREPSCIAFGEFHNLLWCQLIPTCNGYGSWEELNDHKVCKGVFDYIKKEEKKKI